MTLRHTLAVRLVSISFVVGVYSLAAVTISRRLDQWR